MLSGYRHQQRARRSGRWRPGVSYRGQGRHVVPAERSLDGRARGTLDVGLPSGGHGCQEGQTKNGYFARTAEGRAMAGEAVTFGATDVEQPVRWEQVSLSLTTTPPSHRPAQSRKPAPTPQVDVQLDPLRGRRYWWSVRVATPRRRSSQGDGSDSRGPYFVGV